MANLDRINRAIVRELQKDGRLSNHELAARVGLSPSPCHRRVRQLEKSGVIRGYTAIVDAEQYGLPISISVLIRLERRTKENILLFEEHILALDCITECALITGPYDYLLRLYMDDLKSYEALLKEKLAVIPGISEIQSNIYISEIKKQATFPDL